MPEGMPPHPDSLRDFDRGDHAPTYEQLVLDFVATIPAEHLGDYVAYVESAECDELLDVLPDGDRERFQFYIDTLQDRFWQDRVQDEDVTCDAVDNNYADLLDAAVRMQAYSDVLLAHIGGARRVKVHSRKPRTALAVAS